MFRIKYIDIFFSKIFFKNFGELKNIYIFASNSSIFQYAYHVFNTPSELVTNTTINYEYGYDFLVFYLLFKFFSMYYCINTYYLNFYQSSIFNLLRRTSFCTDSIFKIFLSSILYTIKSHPPEGVMRSLGSVKRIFRTFSKCWELPCGYWKSSANYWRCHAFAGGCQAENKNIQRMLKTYMQILEEFSKLLKVSSICLKESSAESECSAKDYRCQGNAWKYAANDWRCRADDWNSLANALHFHADAGKKIANAWNSSAGIFEHHLFAGKPKKHYEFRMKSNI